jgi:DNA-binding Lrp family transcriptional regulator
MPEAFVCINASPDSVDQLLIQLKACKEIKEAFRVYGVYDIITKVTAETLEDLSNIIDTRIKRLSEVQNTLSMPTMNPPDFAKKTQLLTV